ncbi:Hypothetical predicted protein [Mytilus galloprovincialis]|uniref:Uncharacterized protein n=1 Tax=Mytilus galloprovincialis TaxID=29158 RepID=A0A8B6CUH7_MYTGA|nr:Hypothetical predicted protein [Mytilus galloprovincialis]
MGTSGALECCNEGATDDIGDDSAKEQGQGTGRVWLEAKMVGWEADQGQGDESHVDRDGGFSLFRGETGTKRADVFYVSVSDDLNVSEQVSVSDDLHASEQICVSHDLNVSVHVSVSNDLNAM